MRGQENFQVLYPQKQIKGKRHFQPYQVLPLSEYGEIVLQQPALVEPEAEELEETQTAEVGESHFL